MDTEKTGDSPRRRTESENGIAMLVAMMALLLMSALGVAVILTSSSETIIAAHFRNSLEARYAADAMIERALDDVAGVADWNTLIGGLTQSALIDGAPTGLRTLGDGSTIDLAQVVNLANCQKTTACSVADMNAIAADRPWGANNPQWKPYAYGPLRDMLPASSTLDSPYYVLLLIGDDPSETDNDPTTDDVGVTNPGWDVIAMRSEAFGPHGAHKVIEVTAGRTVDIIGDGSDYNIGVGEAAMRILSWREVR
jgi:hypothetical protein